MPHHSQEAEQSVIGGIILNPDRSLLRVREILRPSDFFDTRLGEVYSVALELSAAGVPIDVTTLADALAKRGKLERVGGIEALSDLPGKVSTVENIAFHARIVRDKALTRAVRAQASQLLQSEAEGADLLREAQDGVRLIGSPSSDLVVPVGAVLDQIKKEALEVRQFGFEKTALAGVPSGIGKLDSCLTFRGLPRGRVTTLAGVTNEGKSALAKTITIGALKSGKSALCVTLEDDKESLACRMLSELVKIQNDQMQRRVLGAKEWDKFEEGCRQLRDSKLWFIDACPGNVSDLTMAIRGFCQRETVDLVVVDFLQLLKPSRRNDSKSVEVGETFDELVSMASGLKTTATLVISQLNRTKGSKPTVQDLFWSSKIEHGSHTIGLLWRPTVKCDARCCVLVIGKQKNGWKGDVVLGWAPEYVAFADPDFDEADRYRKALSELKE